MVYNELAPPNNTKLNFRRLENMNDFRLETLTKKDFNNEIEFNLFRNGRVTVFEEMIAEACIKASLLSERTYKRIMEAHKSSVTKGLLAVRQEIANNLEYGDKYDIRIVKKNYPALNCQIVRGASRLVVVMEKTVYKMGYDLYRHGDQNKKEADSFKKALNVSPESKDFIAGLYSEFNAYYASIAVKAENVGKYSGIAQVCDVTGYDYNVVMKALSKIGVYHDLHRYNIGTYQGRPCVVDYGL